jgi:hypothetical protein
MIFLQGCIKFDQGISEKSDGKWNNKNNNNKKQSKSNMSHKLRLGATIGNGAKTRSPQNFIWGLNNNNKKKKKKKKRCKNNKSPNFVWGLNNKKRSKHNMSPKLRLGDIIICNKLV